VDTVPATSITTMILAVVTTGDRGGLDHGGGAGSRASNPKNPYKDLQCQSYGKLGNTTRHYWKRFDKNYTGLKKIDNATSTSYDLDPTWYVSNTATDHITRNLEELIMNENRGGQDQVHATNGASMKIKHIGHSTIFTPP
jgi:hypothetical protein